MNITKKPRQPQIRSYATWRFCQNRRHIVVFITFTLLTILIFFTQQNFLRISGDIKKEKFTLNKHKRYLINTSTCKIPDLDPFNDDIKPFFYRVPYKECSKLDLLTYIEKTDEGGAILKINETVLPQYASTKVQCCFSKIVRIKSGNKTDRAVRTTSPCIEFTTDGVNLTYPYVSVTCKNSYDTTIYNNVHATAVPSQSHRVLMQKSYKSTPFSILLVGIDSISKLNLQRTMPKTHNYLEKNLINLKGYNKIADNTFPNLMAILSGKSRQQVYDKCQPNDHRMEDCDFLWKDLKRLEYITAYGEDECTIATFNYQDWGFGVQPTDFYYRPYMLAAEKLPIYQRYSMSFCTGPETSGERIMNAAKDFCATFRNVPTFGLFWMNSFSHDNINIASAMDEKILQFLGDKNFTQSLTNTMLVFFSDHGFRFGNMRYTHTGWLEERLPFIYVRLPDAFAKLFPKEYSSFMTNTKRLTTPYDLFLTLQNLVQLTKPGFEIKTSVGCPKCQSMFLDMPENRSCEDAGIEQHWCTCKMHNYMNPADKMVVKVSKFVVDEINGVVRSFVEEGELCASYKLRHAVTAGESEEYLNKNNQSVNYFLVLFETVPMAMFEATVEVSQHHKRGRHYFKLLGDISRINRYSGSSYCVKDGALKKFCYCDGIVTTIKSAFCTMFNYCF